MFFRCSLITRVFVLLAFAAIAVADDTFLSPLVSADDGITVERDDQSGTTTVLVATENGWLSWNDVIRGLARAGRLDDSALSGEFVRKRIDLKQRESRFAIRALSATMPDLHLRVIDSPNNAEPVLQIRFDRDDTRNKIRMAKSIVRGRLGGDSGEYRLRLDDQWNGQPRKGALVLLVHGYTAGADSLEVLRTRLTERGWACGSFAYPNDGPIQESAELLAKELARFRDLYPNYHVVILAHSMGGLVARAAIEDPRLDPGNVKRLIMVCTPNGGSRWAELPGGLDVCEHLGEMKKLDFPESFRASFADGLNEARSDLKPQSKFLRELNSRSRNPDVSYSLILGTSAPLTTDEMSQLNDTIANLLAKTRSGRLAISRATEFLHDLDELENGKGDTVVSIERGKLAGVDDTLLLPIHHWTITLDVGLDSQKLLFDAIFDRVEQ